MQRRAEELEDFKISINLSEYAAASGYRLDRKVSCRNSAVTMHSSGDKIIIARGTDQHWIILCARRVTAAQHRFCPAPTGRHFRARPKGIAPLIGESFIGVTVSWRCILFGILNPPRKI
jgi:hypothetical protein